MPHPESAILLFSHGSHLLLTGQKRHTRTAQHSYQGPSPRTWPRRILSSDLTPQKKHPSDTLYSPLTGAMGTPV